jgi:hypothetical protein
MCLRYFIAGDFQVWVHSVCQTVNVVQITLPIEIVGIIYNCRYMAVNLK